MDSQSRVPGGHIIRSDLIDPWIGYNAIMPHLGWAWIEPGHEEWPKPACETKIRVSYHLLPRRGI